MRAENGRTNPMTGSGYQVELFDVLPPRAEWDRLPAEGIADKELSALLRRERLVPVVHGTTYEELEQVSLLLASRAGLSTAEESLAEVAAKIAELVAI